MRRPGKDNAYPRYLDRESRRIYVKVYESKDEVVIRQPNDSTTNKIMSKDDFENNYVKEL